MGSGRRKTDTSSKNDKLVRFGISIPADLLSRFDGHLETHKKQNRSDAVRDLIRDRLAQDEMVDGKGEHIALMLLVYEAQNHEVQRRLADRKRNLTGALVSAQQLCLGGKMDWEVLILRGSVVALKNDTDSIRAVKGLLHSKVILSPAGAL